MIKSLIMPVLFIICLQVNSQEHQATDVTRGVFKVNFIPLSLSYEARVGPLQTVFFEPGLGAEFHFDNMLNKTVFSMNPYFITNYRYYYNFDKRNSKGKRTVMNSGNYWGVLAEFYLTSVYNTHDSSYEGQYLLVGPVWGIQRNYKSHFSLGLTLGLGAAISDNDVWLDGIGRLSLGFYLGNKKSM